MDFTLTLIGTAPFMAIMAFTPGPNNLMVLSSTVNFGVRRTVPHILGICIGFPLMIAAIGLGLGKLFTVYPVLHIILKVLGIAYLLWLSYTLVRTTSMKQSATAMRPMRVYEAMLFQWVNIKAWIMSITMASLFGGFIAKYSIALAAMCIMNSVITLASLSIWSGFGAMIKQWLQRGNNLRYFNVAMAAALVATIIPMLHG
jgi:threonine/homoserine/homoserine lactone efflux protein